MEWLKPITEKLNVNALILALGITCFGWWFFPYIPIILIIGIIVFIYLLIIRVITFVRYMTDKSKIKHFKEQEEREEIVVKKEENLHIDIWFSSLSQERKRNICSILEWEKVSGKDNLRLQNRRNGMILYPMDCSIERGLFGEPVHLIYPVSGTENSETPVLFIHPYLYELIYNFNLRNIH